MAQSSGLEIDFLATRENPKKRKNRLAQRRHRSKVDLGRTVDAELLDKQPWALGSTFPAAWDNGQAETKNTPASMCDSFSGSLDSKCYERSSKKHSPASAEPPSLGFNQSSTPFGTTSKQEFAAGTAEEEKSRELLQVDTVEDDFDITQDWLISGQEESMLGSAPFMQEIIDFIPPAKLEHGDWHLHCDIAQAGGLKALESAGGCTAKVHPMDSRKSHNFAVEEQIERVLDFLSELRFENLDTLFLTYYTSRFQEGTLARWAQTASYTRKAVPRLAERHYVNEIMQHRDRRESASASDGAFRSCYGQDIRMERDAIAKHVRQLCLHTAAAEELRRDKLYLREQVPDTWALLYNLARTFEVPESQASQAVCIFLRLLGLAR